MFDESRERERERGRKAERERERGHQHKAITQKAGVSTTNVKENFVRCAEKIYAFTSSIEHSAFLQWKNSNIQYPLNCHIFHFTNINKPIIICERRLSFIPQSLTQNVSIQISSLCQLYVVQVTIVTLLLNIIAHLDQQISYYLKFQTILIALQLDITLYEEY